MAGWNKRPQTGEFVDKLAAAFLWLCPPSTETKHASEGAQKARSTILGQKPRHSFIHTRNPGRQTQLQPRIILWITVY